MTSAALSWLVCLCIVQFLVILSLLNKQYGHQSHHHTNIAKAEMLTLRDPKIETNSGAKLRLESSAVFSALHNANQSDTKTGRMVAYSGVAATLLLHAPTWFQRRYTMMIQNAVNNVPLDWVVQIFYTTSGQSQHGLDISPGIQKFVRQGRVVLTPIPAHVLSVKKKRFELMFEPWLWESMLADTVLIFGGNAVICSNSPFTVGNFTHFDYLGGPWDFKKGSGGDGGISIRNKNAMLAAIDYALSKVDGEEEKITAFKKWGQEDQFFVRTLLEMNEKGVYNNAQSTKKWNIATREDTLRFSAIGSAVNDAVLVVSGTLPSVPYDTRQAFLNVCPEIKMFYPALHDPHCFGAEPNGEECAKSICALKSKKERRGGC